jgi:hypothetical protein
VRVFTNVKPHLAALSTMRLGCSRVNGEPSSSVPPCCRALTAFAQTTSSRCQKSFSRISRAISSGEEPQRHSCPPAQPASLARIRFRSLRACPSYRRGHRNYVGHHPASSTIRSSRERVQGLWNLCRFVAEDSCGEPTRLKTSIICRISVRRDHVLPRPTTPMVCEIWVKCETENPKSLISTGPRNSRVS